LAALPNFDLRSSQPVRVSGILVPDLKNQPLSVDSSNPVSCSFPIQPLSVDFSILVQFALSNSTLSGDFSNMEHRDFELI